MSFGAVAAIGGAVIGAGGSMMAAKSQAKAAAKTADANMALWREQNKALQDQYNSGLQRVFGGREGDVRNDIFAMKDRIRQIFAGQGDKVQAMADSYQPMIASQDRFVQSIADGGNLSQRMANLQPVLTARLGSVAAYRDAANNAYQQSQAQRRASLAKQGFIGGGSFADRLGRSDLIGLGTSVANARSSALLQNAQDVYNLQENNDQRLLDTLGLPYQRMQGNLAMLNAVNQARIGEESGGTDEMLKRLGQFAGMVPFSASVSQAPTVQYQADTGLGNALSGLGSSIASYGTYKMGQEAQAKQNQSMMDFMKSMYQPAPKVYRLGGGDGA